MPMRLPGIFPGPKWWHDAKILKLSGDMMGDMGGSFVNSVLLEKPEEDIKAEHWH